MADQICEIIRRYGFEVQGYHSPDLPFFTALAPTQQDHILRHLEAFLHTLKITEGSGIRLDSQKKSLWSALTELKMHPPSTMFSCIADEDRVIEIFDLNGLQFWRNFNFFKVCSYTLEEIYCIEWNHRYYRSPEMNAHIMEKVTALLTGQTEEIFCSDISEHELEETRSNQRLLILSSHDLMCRLRDHHGQLVAWMVVSKGRLKHRIAQTPYRPLSLVPQTEI